MIKKFLNYLFKQDKKLMRNSVGLFFSMFVLNIAGYIFHFFVGRTLGPEDYGIFGAVLSLIYIITIPMNTLQTSITNFVSNFKAKNEVNKINYLLKKSLKKAFIISILITALFLIISPLIAYFLNTEKISPFLSVGLFLFFSLILPVNRGVLQGLQNFKELGWNYIIEGIIKLVFGIILIYLIGLNGAILAFGLSYTIPFIISFMFLKPFMKNGEKVDIRGIYKYSFPVLIMLTSLTLFYSIDVILVKHFFSAVDAGYYAAISLLAGKIVFFGSISISMIMFPRVAELHALKSEHRSVLYKSMLLVFLFGAFITLFYFLFPNFSVGLLFGKEYLSIASMMWVFSGMMTIFSLIYLLSFYNMSIQKTKFIYLLVLFNIAQIVLIYLFHNTLWQIIWIMCGIMLSLLLLMWIITLNKKNEIKYNYTGLQ